MLLPLLGVVLVSGGCDRREPSPTAPEAAAAVGDPRQSIRLPGYVPMGTASIPLPSLSGPGTDVGWTALGTVRAGEYVRVRVSGEITIRLNPAFVDEYCQGNPLSNAAQCGRPPETVGAEGVSGGMLVVAARILYPDGDWVYVPLSPSPLFPGERVGAWQARADGVVEYMRTGHHWVYGGIPVFALEGSQTVSLDVTRQEAKLKLDCTGGVVGPDGNVRQEKDRVTRGQELSCVASRDPTSIPGEVTITAWSFDGKKRTNGEVTSTTWAGVMVRSGTVKVEGKVGDRTAEPATASITVLDRDWSNKAPGFVVKEVGNGSDPRMRPILPEVPQWMHHLGHANFFKQESEASLPADPTAEVRIGPNEGLYYFADVPLTVYGLYVLNRVALRTGSAFVRVQEPGSVSSSIGAGTPWCTRSAVPGMLADVEAHERKHVEVYRETYTRAFSPHAQQLER